MKKKLFIFIGLITLILSFMLVKPQTKAQVKELYTDYDLIVTVIEEDEEDIFIKFLYFQESSSPSLIVENINFILVGSEALQQPLSYYYLGQRFKLLYRDTSTTVVNEVSEYYNDETSLIDGFQYRYIKTEGSYHYFIRDMDIYKIPISYISFNNSISGLIEFTTTTKADNIYIFNDSLKIMYFSNSRDYQYALGRELAAQDITDAYRMGKDVGYNEGLIDGYENGKSDGLDIGYNEGYDVGYDEGYNKAIDDLEDNSQYVVGYNKGYSDGVKDEVVKNSKNFYDGIGNWLVPAIIVILVFSVIITFKKRNSGVE